MADLHGRQGSGPAHDGRTGLPDEEAVAALALDAALALRGVLSPVGGAGHSGASPGKAGGRTADDTPEHGTLATDELLDLAATVRSLPRLSPASGASSASPSPGPRVRRRRRQVAHLATAAAALTALGLGADQLLQPGGAVPGPVAAAQLSRAGGRLVLTGDDGRLAGRVTGMTCPTRSRCLAVLYPGDGDDAVLARSDDGGASWRAVEVPDHPEELSAVLCTSPEQCWAVGSTAAGHGVLLATSDGGSRWQADTAPAGVASLSDVACAGVVYCWAVGATDADSAAIVATTDGRTWSTEAAPSGTGPLRAVACPTVRTCWAGGSTTDAATVVATADGGTSWAAQPLPSGGAADGATAVTSLTCTPAASCWATTTGSSLVLLADTGSGWQASDEIVPSTGLVDEPTVCADGCTRGSPLPEDATLRAVEGNGSAGRELGGRVATTGAVACPRAVQCWVVQRTAEGFTSRPVDPTPEA